MGGGSCRERLLGLAALTGKNGAVDFPDVVTEPGLFKVISDRREAWKRKHKWFKPKSSFHFQEGILSLSFAFKNILFYTHQLNFYEVIYI